MKTKAGRLLRAQGSQKKSRDWEASSTRGAPGCACFVRTSEGFVFRGQKGSGCCCSRKLSVGWPEAGPCHKADSSQYSDLLFKLGSIV